MDFSNDLRPRNYVTLIKDGVEKDYELDAFDIYKVSESECADIKPIPLTEDWHNKFGVEKDGFHSFEYDLPRNLTIKCKVVFDGDYVFLRQDTNGKRHDDSLVTIWNKDLTKRDMYVHEWQNTYRRLAGEELTIKK